MKASSAIRWAWLSRLASFVGSHGSSSPAGVPTSVRSSVIDTPGRVAAKASRIAQIPVDGGPVDLARECLRDPGL